MGGSIPFLSLLPFLYLIAFLAKKINLFFTSLLLFLLFYCCLRFRFPDKEENPGPRTVPCDKYRIMFSNIKGLHGNLEDLQLLPPFRTLFVPKLWSLFVVMWLSC